MKALFWFVFTLLLSFFSFELLTQPYLAQHSKSLWFEGNNKKDGANFKYKNKAALMPWKSHPGDWCDVSGNPQGNQPFEIIRFDRKINHQKIDVTAIVARAIVLNQSTVEFIFRHISGGSVDLYSREHIDKPQLIYQSLTDQISHFPTADTVVVQGTHKTLGKLTKLSLNKVSTPLIRFVLPINTKLLNATLVLPIKKHYGKPLTAGLYNKCADKPHSKVEKGLASNYQFDEGIEQHPAVLFADNFNGWWRGKNWSYGSESKKLTTVAADDKGYFLPLHQEALKVSIPRGQNIGMNMAHVFKKEQVAEPEALYFRYYLRFDQSWETVEGGKLPGLSGTYNTAGWGGRTSNGFNGWSARGAYRNILDIIHPLQQKIPVGNYVYHAGQTNKYGDNLIWSDNALGYLEKNRWYCIEQYVSLNTPNAKNGILRGWIDGQLAFENTQIEFRKTSALKIEKVWMNIYHGGVKKVKKDIHLYIDNVVVAHKYIGPINAQ